MVLIGVLVIFIGFIIFAYFLHKQNIIGAIFILSLSLLMGISFFIYDFSTPYRWEEQDRYISNRLNKIEFSEVVEIVVLERINERPLTLYGRGFPKYIINILGE